MYDQSWELLYNSTSSLRSGVTSLDTADATARRRPNMDAVMKQSGTSTKQDVSVVASLEALERFTFQNEENRIVECQEGMLLRPRAEIIYRLPKVRLTEYSHHKR